MKKENLSQTKVIDGDIYRDMVTSGANALDNERDEINNLNVFPVPDGDTGINMSLTMVPARNGELAAFKGNLSEVSDKVAKNFLRSARGNSGVILSSFFKGVGRELKETESADTVKLAAAFTRGVELAYKSVMAPKEGTILTVMRASAEKATEITSSENGAVEDMVELFDAMLTAARDMLAQTPEMLPVLKQANVVDAGGCGFVTILSGMLSYLKNEPVESKNNSDYSESKQADFSQFSTEDITFPYCTECIVTKSKEYEGEGTVEALHEFVINAGDSVVFVEDSDIIKIHVHTDDPGKVLSEAVKYGSFYTVKIENMRNQHSGLIEANEEKASEETDEFVSAAPEKPYGFVSVCSGDGIKAVFTDLGVDKLVIGGQTMNPSTDDMLKAIAATPAETVFVLPNNSNIYLVAKAAAELTTDKRVEVIKTVSIPQGVSAMFAFCEDLSVEENRAAMEKRVAETKTTSVTYAAHDSTFDGKKIKTGQMLGLVENKVKYVTDTREECLALVSDAVKKNSIITVYYGEDVTAEEAEKAVEIISEKVNPYAEVTLVNGGQPVYAYIISGEDE